MINWDFGFDFVCVMGFRVQGLGWIWLGFYFFGFNRIDEHLNRIFGWCVIWI